MNTDDLEVKIEIAIKTYQQQVSSYFLLNQKVKYEDEPVPFRFRDSSDHLFYITCKEYNECSILMEINYLVLNKKRYFKNDIDFKFVNEKPQLVLNDWIEISPPTNKF